MTRKPQLELLGHVGVDAGLIWIGDPCYCVTPDCNEHPAATWSEFCDKLDHEKPVEAVFPFRMGHDGLGVCLSTRHGDGSYPVYVERDNVGRVVAATIRFDD